MKILHAIRGLANSSGTTHIVGPLAEAQARLGHDVHVYFVDKPRETAVVPAGELVTSRRFPMTLSTENLGWSVPYGNAIRSHVSQFDVVHIHAIWNYVTWSTMRAAARAGVPYIVAPQGSLEQWALRRNRYLKRMYAALFENRWFHKAARIQALTSTEAEQCTQYGIRAKTAVLPNGVDLEAIDQVRDAAPLRQELGLAPQELLILFLGRLFPKKGLDLLIDAFTELALHQDDCSLLIAGHDSESGYRRELESRIEARGIRAKVRFLGELQGPRKISVLRACDLFVLSSYSEGLPVAAIEAMACGLPVVITPHCNLPEVGEMKAGWITKASTRALASALTVAVRDRIERGRRGNNARKLVERHFTWEKIARNSLEIYEDMAEKKLVRP